VSSTSRGNKQDDDAKDDGNSRRTSRRLSGDNGNDNDAASIPAQKKLRFSPRNFKYFTDVDNLPKKWFCSGCVRWDESTKKKPREEIKTREMKCYKGWTKHPADVSPILRLHVTNVKAHIASMYQVNESALINKTPQKETNNNVQEELKPPPSVTPATKPPPALNYWEQTIRSQGRTLTFKIPKTHELVHTSHLKALRNKADTLGRVRDKLQSCSNFSNLYAQSLWAIACASVPALALSAAQYLFPIVWFVCIPQI